MIGDGDYQYQPEEAELVEEAEDSPRRGRTEIVALVGLLLIIFAGVVYADAADPSEGWQSDWTYEEAVDPFTDVVTAYAVLPSREDGLEEAGLYLRCATGKPLLAEVHDHNPNSTAITEAGPDKIAMFRFDRQRPFRIRMPESGELGTRSEPFANLLSRSKKLVTRYEGAFSYAEFNLTGARGIVSRLRAACDPARPAKPRSTNFVDDIGKRISAFFNSLG